MQNYLQTSGSTVKAVKTILALFAITLAIVPPIAVKMDILPMKRQSLDEGKYMYSTILNKHEEESNSYELQTNDRLKMNNFTSEIAKTTSHTMNNNIIDLPSDRKVRVLASDGRVNQMNLEDYISGCVFGEMPLSFEPQAIMAQSVAVRSFTVRQMTCGTSKHKNADVCTNPACCQNFVSTDSLPEEERKYLADAVNATKGMIMTYDGLPIEAVYHASSGSATLDSEDVWGGRVEYLRSVKSPDGEEAISVSGMGHRVGMSQHGANLLAREGMNYIGILKYYYSGISFDFLS